MIPTGPTHAQRLIDACADGFKVCTMTAAYCANEGGEKADPHRLQVLFDCADLCELTVGAASRASRFLHPVAALCADVSRACADAYAPIEHGDGQLRKLYAVCALVAEACDEFTGKQEARPVADERDHALRESFPASDPVPTPSQGSPSSLANNPGTAG